MAAEDAGGIAVFEAKETVNTGDVVAYENAEAVSGIRLRKDLLRSEADLADAEADLIAARRSRDLAAVADVRTRVAPLRRP